ncbi:MAG: glycosyltransferase [Candidatus Acididesulfobacter diazotrophicus]|uniref:Glycosyltransferase n=1 Tax=Candidatus Acididesulfobacter diazotrophicus TaxID=2597226 RepID=A0A519BK13_9DELT|nr:MAG: glycosyltransferase [Candidatus Acididesulfobacter diazotrophicus]
MIAQIILSFFISFFVIGGILLYFAKGGKIGLDDCKGIDVNPDSLGNEKAHKSKPEPQKFHIHIVSRLGGAGIFSAFFIVLIIIGIKIKEIDYIYLPLTALPVFLMGFTEDLTRRISPKFRLLGALVSAILAAYFLNAYLVRIDIGFIDGLLSVKAMAVIFTIFAVTGVANSFNIIDGFNGLSSAVSIIILLSLGYISFKVGDIFLMKACLILAFAIFGFFVWNYPFGKIFLGDGGAYFIGFTIAVVSVLLVDGNKAVSPWFPFLLCIYPIFETLFSMYRRRARKSSSMDADAFHLHSLIYKRLVPHILGTDIKNNQLARNSATSPFLWMLTSFSAVPALLFWNNTPVLIVFAFIFIIVYVWLYKSIVGFKLWKFIKKKA